MPSGSKPGERRGGRQKGTPNRGTIEAKALRARGREAEAEMTVEERQQARNLEGAPLAKEVLENLMMVFLTRARFYDPAAGRQPDEAQFEKWALHTVAAAKECAKYQSPTFRAIALAPPPPESGSGTKRFTLAIFDNHNEGREIVAIADAAEEDI